VRALVIEIKAIVLAMKAIRSIQPEARLVHTEDGGAIFSAPALEPFRREREQRRWLGTDLLCGFVTRDHPLFGFLLEHGIAENEVLWFSDNPCRPAVLGLNYYVTSDRYLDNRLHLYPSHFTGGDEGREPLVDIEAVRVRPEGISGVTAILMEAWQRYRIPTVITEAHLGDNCDEQIRWLAEVWRGALAAREAGAHVRAVTVWALLGSWNWCNLCTEDSAMYEPGAFHLNGKGPERTQLGEFVQQILRGELDHPALAEQGWWRLPDRLQFAASDVAPSMAN
jgi:dTDP-4-dehydrorhamnose reductase